MQRYSIQNTTIIKFPGGNKIEVYTPELYQPDELEDMVTPKEPEIEIEAPDMDMDDGGDFGDD